MTANPGRHVRALEVLAGNGGNWYEACLLMATKVRQVRRYLDRHGRHDIAVRLDRNSPTPCDAPQETRA